eukprot:scpid58769/ scgid0789/ 
MVGLSAYWHPAVVLMVLPLMLSTTSVQVIAREECNGFLVEVHSDLLGYTAAKEQCSSGSLFNPENRFHSSSCAYKYLAYNTMKNNKHYQYWTADPSKVLHYGQNSSWYDAVLVDGDATHLYLTACFDEYDECEHGFHDCGKNPCINTEGSYRCDCTDNTNNESYHGARCDGWKTIGDFGIAVKVFPVNLIVPVGPHTYNEAVHRCDTLSGGSRVYLYNGIGNLVTSSLKALHETIDLANDPSSYWVRYNGQESQECFSIHGTDAPQEYSCKSKRQAMCSRPAMWYRNEDTTQSGVDSYSLKCMPNTYFIESIWRQNNTLNAYNDAARQCKQHLGHTLPSAGSVPCLVDFMELRNKTKVWTEGERAVQANGEYHTTTTASIVCEAQLHTQCWDGTGSKYNVFAFPHYEFTWKAAKIKCEYQGGKMFDISQNTECFKNFLLQLRWRISSQYMWAVNNHERGYGMDQWLWLKPVTLPNKRGNTVVCTLKLYARCGNIHAEVMVENTKYTQNKERAAELCGKRSLYNHWFHESKCMYEFLQPVTVHYRFSEFWAIFENQVVEVGQHGMLHVKTVNENSTSMVVCINQTVSGNSTDEWIASKDHPRLEYLFRPNHPLAWHEANSFCASLRRSVLAHAASADDFNLILQSHTIRKGFPYWVRRENVSCTVSHAGEGLSS